MASGFKVPGHRNSTFKPSVVTPAQAAVAESVTGNVPLVGDPRMAAPVQVVPDPLPATIESKVGSRQESNLGASQDRGSAAKYAVGNVYDIPIGQIKSNPLNPRAVYTTTAVENMAQSLATSGQRISATGYIDDQGDVTLIEGETRLRGAKSAGLPTLRVEIRPRPVSDRDLYEEARAANVERRDQTPLDDALKWKELLALKVYPTQSSLAKALGLGEDSVSRTLSLAILPRFVMHAVAEHPDLLNLKMLNAVREYWEVQGEEQRNEATLELIAEVAKNGMGYRDVIARRKAAEKGPMKRPRSTREALTFRGAKGELKSFEEDGRVELSLKGLSPDAAHELTQKLMALFPKE